MSNVIEKTGVLRKEFLEAEINHDELITLPQLYAVLDFKAKKKFDRDVGQQLYDRMNHDYNGRLTVDEFIKVWLQAEEILKNKIESCKKFLQDYHRQRKDSLIKLEEVRTKERINQYGVMEDSNLIVTLISGQGFDDGQSYALLYLDQQKSQTSTVHGPFPQFNQTFNFQIHTGSEELQIHFISQINATNSVLLGTLTIALLQLTNQNKLEQQYNLYDKDGNQIKANVKLELQWLHSRAKYLNEMVERWNDSIQTQEEDLLDYERDLATLYEPFQSMIQVYQGMQQSDLTKLAVNQQPVNTFVNTPVSIPQQNTQEINTIARILILAILFLAILAGFQKAQFLDFIICFAFIIIYQSQYMQKENIIYIAISFGISSILDIVWLAKYSKNWWDIDAKVGNHTVVADSGMLRLVLVMVYIELFAKILTVIVLGILGQGIHELSPVNTRDNKEKLFQIGQHNDLSGSTYYQGQ